jgi:uncharacterized membrane protein YesL
MKELLAQFNAMVRYSSFSDWLISRSGFDLFSSVVSVAAFVWVVASCWRHFPLRPPYLSGLFVLGLCPVIVCATNALTDIYYRWSWDDWTPHYVSTYLKRDLEVALFGGLTTILSLVIYSLVYAFSRGNRNGQA